LVLLSLICSANASYYGDPSRQEIEMFEWTGGARLPFCIDAPLADVAATFKKAVSSYLTTYCNGNRTHCNLRESIAFGPQHVMFLDGFPRREFDSLNLRFMVMLPHDSRTIEKQTRPLLPRSVLAATLEKSRPRFRNEYNWNIISFERYPRYSTTTEFMNIAIIPIIVISLPLMVFLAYWTSTLRPNMSTESFMVSGASGGKNYAYRRTLEIIAEQNLEIERERKLALTRHIPMTPPREVVGKGVGMLLDVAKLSIDTAHLPSDVFRKKAKAEDKKRLTTSVSQPQINIEPGSQTPSLADVELGEPGKLRVEIPLEDVPEHEVLQIEEEDEYEEPPVSSFLSVQPVHPHYARFHKGFRRMSSFDEVGTKRRPSRPRLSTSTSSSSGTRRQWKTGSLMLFGGRKG
ncbi:hypothetical protein PMAYCL1PPCAC_01882, partial [Pristionchus mayeri]